MIKNKDTKKRYNLPSSVKFCTKCTISNQRPRISFNDQGVCSACQYAEYKKTKIDWNTKDFKEIAEQGDF